MLKSLTLAAMLSTTLSVSAINTSPVHPSLHGVADGGSDTSLQEQMWKAIVTHEGKCHGLFVLGGHMEALQVKDAFEKCYNRINPEL
jgi:hypothetical protein